jgi:hypothetical protein
MVRAGSILTLGPAPRCGWLVLERIENDVWVVPVDDLTDIVGEVDFDMGSGWWARTNHSIYIPVDSVGDRNVIAEISEESASALADLISSGDMEINVATENQLLRDWYAKLAEASEEILKRVETGVPL